MDNKTKQVYEQVKKKAKTKKDLERAQKGSNMAADAIGLKGLKGKLRARQKMLDDI